MHRLPVVAGGVAAVLVALLLLASLGVFNSTHKSHHASCWARPGVIGYAGPHRYVPVYRSTGTRHGPGSRHGECGA